MHKSLLRIQFEPSVGIGCSLLGKPQELRHRGAAAVEAERELVQVGLEVLMADAMMSPTEPGLEVPEDAVDAARRGTAGAPRASSPLGPFVPPRVV